MSQENKGHSHGHGHGHSHHDDPCKPKPPVPIFRHKKPEVNIDKIKEEIRGELEEEIRQELEQKIKKDADFSIIHDGSVEEKIKLHYIPSICIVLVEMNYSL